MFDNTVELAENKLLLLYVLREIKLPISNNQITQLILENNFINYFTLQQNISELVASDFIEYIETSGKHRLMITDKGIKVLKLFQNRISQAKLEIINDYLSKNLQNIQQEITILADYTIEKENNFVVSLKALENDSTLIDIKVNVATNNQARELCAKWKNESDTLYKKIITLLTES